MLSATLQAGDREGFVRRFTTGQPAQQLAARLWDSWRSMGVQNVALEDGELQVRWPSVGVSRPFVDRCRPLVVEGLITDVLPGSGAQALWLSEQTAVHRGERSVCLSSTTISDADAAAWLTAADAAAQVVASAQLGVASAGWDGVLLVVLPSRVDSVARLTGLSAEAAASTQAATVSGGVQLPSRIVANLARTSSLGPVALRTLLVHEGVHAATRSSESKAPLWVVEGLAESIASASDPDNARTNRTLVADGGRPTCLPTDDELAGSQAQRAYALASVAMDAAIARWGRPNVMTWVADWTSAAHPSDADLTATYLAALPR